MDKGRSPAMVGRSGGSQGDLLRVDRLHVLPEAEPTSDDHLRGPIGPEDRQKKLEEYFINASRFEHLFWDMAYNETMWLG